MAIFSLSLQFKNNLNNRTSKDQTIALLSQPRCHRAFKWLLVFAGIALMSTPVQEGICFLRSSLITLRRRAEWWLSSQASGWLLG